MSDKQDHYREAPSSGRFAATFSLILSLFLSPHPEPVEGRERTQGDSRALSGRLSSPLRGRWPEGPEGC